MTVNKGVPLFSFSGLPLAALATPADRGSTRFSNGGPRFGCGAMQTPARHLPFHEIAPVNDLELNRECHYIGMAVE